MIDQGLETSRQLSWGRAEYPHPGQWLGTGNRCGHDPLKGEFERYQPPETQRALPKTQQALLDGARDYYEQPGLLPTLSNLSGKANADGSPRSNRSEGRAAESLVLSAIIQLTDFSSLRVGTPCADGGFIPRSCAELAKVAGLANPDGEPSQRFWRAFRRLKVAGAFTVHRQYEEREDGSKRARPAIKKLSMQFLVCLGKVGWEKLKDFRTWASNKLKKRRRKYRDQFPQQHDAEQARRQVATTQTAESGIQARLPIKRRGRRDIPDVDPDLEAQRRYNLESNEYFAHVVSNNPGASVAEVRKLVRLRYPPFEVWLQQQR